MPTRSAPPSRAAHRTESRQAGHRHTGHRQAGPRPHGQPARVDFDEFYLANRRRLLLQCLALTGDLAAARSAVRDAFVAAAQHWRKVSRLDDPESWVRPHAWGAAQRRSVARIWHREKGLTDQQTAVLDALSKLPDVQRRTILLTHLAAAPLGTIGRELALTQAHVERHLQQATSALSLALDCESTQLRTQLESLAPLVTSPGLPRVTAIRRAGRRRQRLQAGIGTLTAVALALGAGWFVSQPGSHGVRVLSRPVTAAMLLAPAEVQSISPKQTWKVADTGDNTKGDGINTVCQRSRFADDRGIGSWVRRIVATGSPARTVVQTVEVSQSPGAAVSTYRTTLGWYAGCTDARVHLTGAYKVHNLGDQAEAVRLVLQPMPKSKAQPVNFVVAVTRSGMLTTTTVLQSATAQPAPLGPVLTASASSLRSMCASSAIDRCRVGPAAASTDLPRSGEAPGMLATVDLPAVGSIAKPWVGTDPVRGGPNLAATTCDQADFTKAGAKPSSRTFLIPEQSDLPQRFGLTETVGTFPTPAAAAKFVAGIRARMKTCEKRQLGSRVGQHFEQGKADQRAGATYSMWRQTAEINSKKATVSYWMGIAQVGRSVAQVNFAPAGSDDLDAATFRALVVRARDRLAELS